MWIRFGYLCVRFCLAPTLIVLNWISSKTDFYADKSHQYSAHVSPRLWNEYPKQPAFVLNLMWFIRNKTEKALNIQFLTKKEKYYRFNPSWVLYMSSDRFLWALESCDLSQTDKSFIWVSSFPSWVMSSRTLNYTKKNIWHLVIWKNLMIWSILSFLLKST